MSPSNRREFILASFAALSAAVFPLRPDARERPTTGTRWTIKTAIGLDAGFALTIAAADESVLQVRRHLDKRDTLREVLGLNAVRAAETLIAALRAIGATHTPGAELALLASAGSLDSVEAVAATFRTEGALQAGFEGTQFFQTDEARADLEVLRAPAADAFRAVAESDFPEFWRSTWRPSLEADARLLGADLDAVDVIAALRPYLSRDLDPDIVVFLTELTEPHGIRVAGQRFVTSPNWPSAIVRRNAVHEMIHPFLEPLRPESAAIVDRLSADPLVRAVLRKSDPSFGYSSKRGLVEEGATQALEAVVNERLGQGRSVGEYWRQQDGGMHLLAAAIYARMKESGFADAGGDALAWLDRETRAGRLLGPSLRELAADVVGGDHVRNWVGDSADPQRNSTDWEVAD